MRIYEERFDELGGRPEYVRLWCPYCKRPSAFPFLFLEMAMYSVTTEKCRNCGAERPPREWIHDYDDLRW